MQQHIFQQFFGPNMGQSQQNPLPQYIFNNELVLEITNNWRFVRWLLFRHREGKLTDMDQMEQAWFNFIMSKNIDIESFSNSDEFLSTFWMEPPQ